MTIVNQIWANLEQLEGLMGKVPLSLVVLMIFTFSLGCSAMVRSSFPRLDSQEDSNDC